jgi:ubiquinone/menaquinone biosynthesis C-methylase UbiE
MEARWALERLDWATAASLPARPSPRYPMAESVPHFARAVGLARSGRPEQASADIERLAALQKTLAEAKNLYWARQLLIQLKVASAWVERARGRDAGAVALMQDAATAEETSETHDTLSPGPIGMTAHEALGLLLLELGRPGEAFGAFEASLRTSKSRLRSYAGAAAAAATVGNTTDVAHVLSLVRVNVTRTGAPARSSRKPRLIFRKQIAPGTMAVSLQDKKQDTKQDKTAEIAFFDKHAAADDYNVFTPAANALLIETAIRLLQLERGARIGDLGCGSGIFSGMLRGAGYVPCGLDISPKLIELARRNYPDIEFFEGDVENLPFPTASLDGLVLMGIVHHFPDPSRCTQEAFRVLRPAGRFVAFDPNRANPFMYLYRDRSYRSTAASASPRTSGRCSRARSPPRSSVPASP